MFHSVIPFIENISHLLIRVSKREQGPQQESVLTMAVNPGFDLVRSPSPAGADVIFQISDKQNQISKLTVPSGKFSSLVKVGVVPVGSAPEVPDCHFRYIFV